MLATNPAPVKISKSVTAQASVGNDLVIITKKLYNGQERVFSLKLSELQAIVNALA